MKKVSIIGTGTWGIALANMLCLSGHNVIAWSAISDEIDYIEKYRKHPKLRDTKILEDIPDSDETWYITDNLNLTREDKSQAKNPEKILRNAKIDKEGNLIVKKADWTN